MHGHENGVKNTIITDDEREGVILRLAVVRRQRLFTRYLEVTARAVAPVVRGPNQAAARRIGMYFPRMVGTKRPMPVMSG